MIRTTERESRQRRVCESCTLVILPGDYYLEHVASPNHEDLGNSSWWRTTECKDCAERYGRGALLSSIAGAE